MSKVNRNKTYIFTECYTSPDGVQVEAGLTVDFTKLRIIDVECWVVDANEDLPTFMDDGLQYLLDREIIQDYKEYLDTPNENGWTPRDFEVADREYEATIGY